MSFQFHRKNVSERIVLQSSVLPDTGRGHVSASTSVFFYRLHTTAIFSLTFLNISGSNLL